MVKRPQILNWLGLPKPNYESIWEAQKALADQIASGEHDESIIFCEHEKVITSGRRAKSENILNQNIRVFEIERGGDVTLHLPGQLVIYPLIRLQGPLFPRGLHDYLRYCEEIIIDLLKGFSLDAGRYGPTGVWVRSSETSSPRKIASIGIAVRRWVTYHGISLNISNEISEFRSIRPCDFDAQIMTSLQNEGIHVSLEEVATLISERAFKVQGGYAAESSWPSPKSLKTM